MSYEKSFAHLDRARRVVAGAANTMSKRPERFVQGAYPVFLDHGHGAHVWDVDGHRYVDWILGLGPLTLGYGHPVVNAAIRRQLQDGACFSLPHRLEVEYAEQLLPRIPCARGDGLVRFVSTGTEADMGAARIARLATGRDVIVKCGYLGWADWTVAAEPVHPGVPKVMEELVSRFTYNDLASLDACLDEAAGNVAAIMLEPTLIEPPAPGFLEGVRERATKIGAVLIFDEIVLGWRLALAGGQEHFGVTPDLATFGKAMANGLPIAAIVGRRDVMEHAWPISGTFGGNPLGLAAASAVLGLYARDPVIRMLWTLGEKFQRGFEERAKQILVPARCVGYPVHPRIEFFLQPGDDPGRGHYTHYRLTPPLDYAMENRLAMSVFLQETAARGVLFHAAGFNTSVAHFEDPTALDQSLAACEAALEVVRAGLEADDLAARLRGRPIEASVIRAAPGG